MEREGSVRFRRWHGKLFRRTAWASVGFGFATVLWFCSGASVKQQSVNQQSVKLAAASLNDFSDEELIKELLRREGPRTARAQQASGSQTHDQGHGAPKDMLKQAPLDTSLPSDTAKKRSSVNDNILTELSFPEQVQDDFSPLLHALAHFHVLNSRRFAQNSKDGNSNDSAGRRSGFVSDSHNEVAAGFAELAPNGSQPSALPISHAKFGPTMPSTSPTTTFDMLPMFQSSVGSTEAGRNLW